MGNPKVSVLIPIFGVEKFIRHCASSLFSQTLKDDIEFIFVNDSTKDSSMQILNEVISEFPERQKQIKIINHDGNKGLAAVRKTAVLAAKGDYVIHCDSDDRVEPDIYETMYKTAVNKNADIVICNFFEERANGSHVIKQSLADSCLEIVRSICLYELTDTALSPFLWNRMIKRSFYINNCFFADTRISFLEDLVITIPMHLCTENVALVQKPLYHYNKMNSGSMTREKSLKKIESCRLAKDYIERFLHCKSADNILPELNKRFFFYYLPLITSLEAYNPRLWLKLVDSNTKVELVSRSRISVWLVRHKLFTLNKTLNLIIRLIFKK